MKKFYYISGTRDGGLWEMEQGSRERGPERVHLSASNREKAKIKYSNATNDVSTIVVPFSEGLRHFINEIVFSWQEIYGELTHNEFCRLIPEPELLIEKINFLPNVHNCEDARAVLEVIE